MLTSVRRGLQLSDPLVTFNICRFLRRAVEGEARGRGAGGTNRKDVRLEILKFEGLLELLVQTATGDDQQISTHGPYSTQIRMSTTGGSKAVTETLSIHSPLPASGRQVDMSSEDRMDIPRYPRRKVQTDFRCKMSNSLGRKTAVLTSIWQTPHSAGAPVQGAVTNALDWGQPIHGGKGVVETAQGILMLSKQDYPR